MGKKDEERISLDGGMHDVDADNIKTFIHEASLIFFKEKNFLKSIEILEYALSIYPEDKEIKEALDHVKKQIEDINSCEDIVDEDIYISDDHEYECKWEDGKCITDYDY